MVRHRIDGASFVRHGIVQQLAGAVGRIRSAHGALACVARFVRPPYIHFRAELIMATSARHRFLEDYRTIRSAEGRGSQEAAYYRALPYQDLSGKNSAQWAIRGKSYRYFERNLLSQLERKTGRELDVLDLGAGNCWMSYRLALRKRPPVAVDIFTD